MVRGGVGRKARLADESFLSGLTAGKLKQMFKAEKSARNRQKLQVAYHYKSGRTVAEAAEAACTEYENARRWIVDMRRRGSAAIPHRKSTGRPRKLSRDLYARLAIDVRKGPQRCGYKANAWSFALLHRHAQEKLGAEIAYRTFVDNMHELRLVIKPPRMSRPTRHPPRSVPSSSGRRAQEGARVRRRGAPPAPS